MGKVRGFTASVLVMVIAAAGTVVYGQTAGEPLLGRGGFVPVFGGLSQTAGITAGVRYDLFLRHPKYTLSVDALGSIRGYGGFRGIGGFENERVALYAYGRYRYLPKEVFYGFGSESSRDMAGDYRIDDRLVGVSVAIMPAEIFSVGATVSLMDFRFGDGRHGEYPPVEEWHEVHGIGVDARYSALGVWLELDGREFMQSRGVGYRFAPVEPALRGLDLGASRGWYLSAEAMPYISTQDGVADFLHVEVEGQLYIPLGYDGNGFATRSHLATTLRSDSDDGPPFYMLPALGGASSIRGFAPNRFRDDHALFFNLEYRRSMMLFLDAAAFVDAGQTFSSPSEIDLASMEFGYGVGLRVRVGRFVLGRVDLAHSREGFAVYLRAGTFL